MERYFPQGRTDLVLFSLEHISHEELLDKMLKDREEVAVLRMFARNFSNIDFFLKILPLKDDELAMSEM